jgi:hypothetical protein
VTSDLLGLYKPARVDYLDFATFAANPPVPYVSKWQNSEPPSNIENPVIGKISGFLRNQDDN